MWHEEKIINGVLHWRCVPDGEWIECSKERLTRKLTEKHAGSELYEKAPWWANPDIPAPKVTC